MGLKLEVFESEGKQPGKADLVMLDTLALEEAKLASYDSGYQAGWEDAADAQSTDQGRIRADLARNLQGLSFTYHEARQHILKALDPLLTTIVERILPGTAKSTLAPMILEVLRPIAQKVSAPPITIVLHPIARPAVEALLEQDAGLPVVLQEEETLGEGTAYIRFQGGETQVDLDDAVARISRAVQDFFALNRAPSGKEPDHGQP
jgi:flagellar biosynthesis/type III secretory pathway protein FliH